MVITPIQAYLLHGPVRAIRPVQRRPRRTEDAGEGAGSTAAILSGERARTSRLTDQAGSLPSLPPDDRLADLLGRLPPDMAVAIQSYVQEELGDGLYIEPWRQAIAAYLARAQGDFSGPPPWRADQPRPVLRGAV